MWKLENWNVIRSNSCVIQPFSPNKCPSILWFGIKGSVLLHTLNGVLHTKRRRAKNDLTLHTVCKIFKEKKLKIGKI
jgi:hypothetical protein